MSHQVQLLDFLSANTKLYLAAKEAQNLSTNTLVKYSSVLEMFYDFCSEELDVDHPFILQHINEHFLNIFVIYLRKKKLNPTTQKNILTIIKNFFSFIAKHNPEYSYLKLNLADYSIKTDSKEKPFFNQDEQTRISHYITILDKKTNYLSHRNSLILKLLLNTGIRISELLAIEYGQLTKLKDEKHGELYSILINGKGKKQRYTYIRSDYVDTNINVIKKKNPAKYIFATPNGQPCSRSHIFYSIKNILSKAGINKTGLHIFRHTFARNLVNDNQNLSTIKELLGHSNITTTAQFYAKADEQAKRKALFK